MLGERDGIRVGTAGVLHGRMENRIAQLQVDAEYKARGTDHLNDRSQIGEGVERFQPDDYLARPAGEYLERPTGLVRPGIDQKGTGEAGMELGQLAKQRTLQCATLNRIEISDIAFVHAESRVKGAQ